MSFKFFCIHDVINWTSLADFLTLRALKFFKCDNDVIANRIINRVVTEPLLLKLKSSKLNEV